MDFDRIVPRGGSQRSAFEELCCQVARRTLNDEARFVRLRGDGGDGGVECYYDNDDASRVGWQAKFVTHVDRLIRQADESLQTALAIHPTLRRYVLCFPFDPAGKTRRRGKSQVEKLNEWVEKSVRDAAGRGRDVTIELWPASRIQSLLVEHDQSGGLRHFFFDEVTFTDTWVAQQVKDATDSVGPRYTPELSIDTAVGAWFASFARTPQWAADLKTRVRTTRRAVERLAKAIGRAGDETFEGWPEGLRAQALEAAETAIQAVDGCHTIVDTACPSVYQEVLKALSAAVATTVSLERMMVGDLEAKHGEGRADSPGFRQFMAEYMNSFPAANLDTARDALGTLRELLAWLESPEAYLACSTAFVLALSPVGVVMPPAPFAA